MGVAGRIQKQPFDALQHKKKTAEVNENCC